MSGLVSVTGGTGFIGLHLVRALHRSGWRLRLLARRLPVHPAIADIRFELVTGELRDPMALERLVAGADAVVHLAGAIKATSRREFYAANAEGTAGLARAARQAGVGRLVLVSSLAAREPLLSDYAASKREGEERARREAGPVPWTILRPAAVYGPWDRETLAIFRLARLGILPVPGQVTGRLGLIHVQDVAEAILHALAGEGSGGVHALDDGAPAGHSWPELAAAAGDAIGRRLRLVRVPAALLRSYGFAAGGLARLFGRAAMVGPGKVAEMLHQDWSAGADSFSRDSTWRPAVGLGPGFAATCQWYRAQEWL
ncbi:MAG: NAD-dependent epimerase/dehydratase family protein [Alphaproteobacteria bacterium]|nr:NAD-dependent epimerase/dehydratase family protein [Alphaproteobacteria bacterium]